MLIAVRQRLRGASSLTIVALSAAFLAACASPQPKAMVHKKPRSKEYFAESIFGVRASPRVSYLLGNLPRGGGRDQVGKPYKVRGKMYYPREEKNYRKVGLASWYGEAFHGRLTANGEVYDMTHLTAAHPTMPLPSYARVTNLENGSSVIVRVNDRGPYSDGRLIDLSKRAADMLDYAHSGTAKVKVEYVGRAPLDGHDDQYLMASYRPGNRAPDPSDGLPTGVMIAMNGPTPSLDVSRPATPFPGTLATAAPSAPFATAGLALDEVPLPAFGPIAPERPAQEDIFLPTQVALATMSFAPTEKAGATTALDAMAGPSALSPADIIASWKRLKPGAGGATPAGEPYVAAGTYTSGAEAGALARALAPYGRTVVEKSTADGAEWYSVSLYADRTQSLDALLEAAWANGAPDAIAVRD